MIEYISKYVSRTMTTIYAQLFARTTSTTASHVVNSLKRLPDLTPWSELVHNIVTIMNAGPRAITASVTMAGGLIANGGKGKKPKKPRGLPPPSAAPQPALLRANVAAPVRVQGHAPNPQGPQVGRNVCCWYLSSLGCDKGAAVCSFEHRNPVPGDQAQVDQFFNRRAGGVRGQPCVQVIF